jgi:hypothetical protein
MVSTLFADRNFESRPLGWIGNRVSIFPHVQRTIRTVGAPVIADGLRDGKNVGLGERAIKRGSAMAAGTEADHLVRVVGIRFPFEVVPLKPGRID